MKFEKFAIAEEIKDNLIKNGYFRTTDIQFKAIPAIMNGEDVLAIAQTGSGKTAAFAIPIINNIHQYKTSKSSHSIKCLVMAPTRELAQQIGSVFSKLTKNTKVSCYAIYGGVEQDPQIKQLAGGVDILIATPGRMFDLISQNYIDINQVSVLVLDEADHMLDLGFIDDIVAVKRKLNRKHQTLFFSATINPKIKKLAYSQIKSSALRIQVSPEKMISKNITHSVIKVEMDQKRHLLISFINSNPEAKTIIFVRTQIRAERVQKFLEKSEIKSFHIHGGLLQETREANLDQFRKNKSGILIATDVTARGIDLPGVTHVINYDLPDEPENYVHRLGRTGRGFSKGEAVSFYSSDEIEKLNRIQDFIESEIIHLKVNKHFFEEIKKPNDAESIMEMVQSEMSIYEKRTSRKRKVKNKNSKSRKTQPDMKNQKAKKK